MLHAIIRFSVRNKLIIGLFTLAWIIWGTLELFKLPVDALPDITSNQVQVITVSPTLGSLEVERLITFPIEQASSNIPGITEIRSISRFGLSVVTVVFEDDKDIYWCRQQVAERMVLVKDEIPKEAGSPELAPVTTGLGEIYQYIVKPKPGYESKYDLTELRTIQDWIIRRQLLGTPGVADVSSFGGKLKQYEVAIDPVKMRGIGVTLTDVFTALEKNNQNSGAAYIEKGPALLFVRTEGLAGSLEDIGNIYVAQSATGTPVYVRDVATVRIGSPIRYGALTFKDQGEVSGAVVLMLKGENAAKVIANIEKRMEQIRKTLPEGVEVDVFLNRTKMVNRTLSTVQTNLLEGALIVLLILVFFLGNMRAGLIVASVIPLSMLFAVALMNLFGVSGNLMSLGALDFGLIVDGAVIIVEAVLHRLHSNKHEGLLLRQHQMDTAVEQSAGRMMGAAVFGQIIILIVYIPILSLTGIEGKMFKPMAQTVAFALIGAFILSLTYVPMMTSIVLSKKLKHDDGFSERLMHRMQTTFQNILSKLLLHPVKVVLGSVALFVLAIAVAATLGGEFIPELEEGDFAIDARMMTGTTLQETIESTSKAAHELQKFPEVEKIVTRVGASEIPTDPMPIEMTDIIVNLKSKEEWTSADSYDELANKMSSALRKVPGLTGGFQYPVQMRFNELIAGAKQDVVCKIFGEDLDTLSHFAEKLDEVIKTVDGAKDIFVETVTGLPQVVIRYRKNAIAAHGLSIADVNRVIRTSFAGETAGQIYENERRFDLVVRLSEKNRNDIEDIKTLTISNGKGMLIPLEQVADISIEDGPNQIQREDAKRRITVAFNVRDRDVQSVVEDVRRKVTEKVQLPAGYFVHYGGQFENLTEAKKRLMIAVPLALFLILLILYFSFGSIRYGLLIFTAIPLSAIGGILLLWARDMPFSISAGVGFIALFGVAVLNGIVLINEFNRLKNETKIDMRQLVLKGTAARLRPVLMTAAVASLGFLPMALSTSSGAEVQRPLATVVIGGVLSATLLTLFVLPVLYVWFEKRKGSLKAPALSVLMFFFALTASAQNENDVLSAHGFNERPYTVIPMDSILSMGERNALLLKVAAKQRDIAQHLQQHPYEIPKTNLGIEYGNINSAFADNRLLLNQTFQLPKVYTRQKDYLNSSLRAAESKLFLEKASFRWKVRTLCYRIMDLNRKEDILKRFMSAFAEWERIAAIQLKAGDNNAINLNGIQLQLQQFIFQRRQLEADRFSLIQELSGLVNAGNNIAPSTINVSPVEPEEMLSLDQHPVLLTADAVMEEKKRFVALERNRLSPDLNLGYSNLTIKGWQSPDGLTQKYYGPSNRFGTYQLGLSVPLFSGSSRAKVNAAKTESEIAGIEKLQKEQELKRQLNDVVSRYRAAKSSFDYYQGEGMKKALEISTQTQVRMASGDIPFAERILMLTQQLQAYTAHAEAVFNIQLSVAEYQYLTEKNQ
jgi:cobalt-zinc-cadmium resistance protein CzcA